MWQPTTSNKHLPSGKQTPYHLRAALYFALQKCTYPVPVGIPGRWKIVEHQGDRVEKWAWGAPKGQRAVRCPKDRLRGTPGDPRTNESNRKCVPQRTHPTLSRTYYVHRPQHNSNVGPSGDWILSRIFKPPSNLGGNPLVFEPMPPQGRS